jgi:hypothetical protein
MRVRGKQKKRKKDEKRERWIRSEKGEGREHAGRGGGG